MNAYKNKKYNENPKLFVIDVLKWFESIEDKNKKKQKIKKPKKKWLFWNFLNLTSFIRKINPIKAIKNEIKFTIAIPKKYVNGKTNVRASANLFFIDSI